MLFRSHLRLFLIATALVCAFASSIRPSVNIHWQGQGNSASEPSDGISLYEKGDNLAAIKALQLAVKKDKANLRAWHYLGLSFERVGKTADARKAHEKAARLGDDLLEVLFIRIGASDQTRSFQEIHEPLLLAVQSAQKYIALSGKLSKSKQEEWNNRVESLRDFVEVSDTKSSTMGERQIFSPREVTTKARVLSKPEPQYPEEARRNQVTGTIVLRAIFAADGKVRAIRALTVLPNGLTLMAINAAHRIKFVPATKDGRPVSMYIQLEYNFNLY